MFLDYTSDHCSSIIEATDVDIRVMQPFEILESLARLQGAYIIYGCSNARRLH